MATVRVYIPTYRRSDLLPRAVRSLLAQTYTEWVAELHNDDPTDPFPAQLLEEIRDSRIKLVVHPSNFGPSRTFNLFFRPPTEDFISILEDDNWWEPEFLENMLETASAHPQANVFWANMMIWRQLEDKSFLNSGRSTWPISDTHSVMAWGQSGQVAGAIHSNGACLIRREAAEELQIVDVPFAAMEAIRERCFPHPIVLNHRILANFSLTLSTSRSQRREEWLELQILLTNTFFENCVWSESEIADYWTNVRQRLQSGAGNLVLGAFSSWTVFRMALKHATRQDIKVALRGLVRRPWVLGRIIFTRRLHSNWWQFVSARTNQRWVELDKCQSKH